MSHFIVTDRKTDYLLPPSLDDWLNQDHLARFIVEVIDQLDLSKLTAVRWTGIEGVPSGDPAGDSGLWLRHGYLLQPQAGAGDLRFGGLPLHRRRSHPDHDSLATFRRRFLDELSDLFVQVLAMAKEMKLLKLGNVCLDGTKIEANASRHSALSHGHIEKLEAQLKAEVQELFALAEQADQADVPDGVSLPEEIKRREDRLAAMAVAKAKIAARAEERYQREKAEYDEKMARRAAKEEAAGKKLGGKPPKAPEPGARDSDQINLTDEESRIMPVAGGGFEQAYNAQAGVDAATMLVVAVGVTQAPNDKEQVEPMLATLKAQAEVLGPVESLIADTGFCSEKNIKACEAAGIDPVIAVARDEHHPDWRERHSEPAPLPENATPVQAMSHRLKTKAGRALYALRKQTVEPVFGIIKSVMGFRQFSLRGLKKVTGEWTLVCLAWNLKRMAKLRPQ
jgi:hypothetical protein